MKKPVSKFALALWVLAAMYTALQIGLWFYFRHMDRELIELQAALVRSGQPAERLPDFSRFLSTPPNFVLEIAILASLGMLIEIGDKIRWLLERRPD